MTEFEVLQERFRQLGQGSRELVEANLSMLDAMVRGFELTKDLAKTVETQQDMIAALALRVEQLEQREDE